MDVLKTVVLVTYFTILSILSIYGAHRLWMLLLYFRHKSHPPQPKGGRDFEPMVTVQLAVFNEINVVERLMDHVVKMDWPKEKLEIQMLDDSTDDTVRVAQAVCEKYRNLGWDISYIHRTDRTGYKAGALDNGLKTAKGEFVAMFDADFLPTVDFLRQGVPHFADDNIAFVQGCWDHLNRDFSLLTQVQAILLDGHFVFEHTARHRSRAFFNFSGTAGMWRVSAIADAGGWEHDTITEDADLSYRAQLKGWRGVYLKDMVVPAELPVEVNAFKSQQHRWAKGNAQVIRKLMKTILFSKESLHTKAECWFHLTANCNYMLMVILAVIMVPSMYFRAGTPPLTLLLTDGPFFLLNAVSVGLYFGLSQREVYNNKNWTSRLKYVPGLMSLGIGLCLNQSKAVLEGFFTDDIEFKRTPKLGVDEKGNGATTSNAKAYKVPKSLITFLELAFAFYYFGAVVVAVYIRKWASVPFLWLFFSGFAYISFMSLADVKIFRRLAMEELEDDETESTLVQ
ncbi:glycosyltransferase [Mesoterricola silvestris]|uniref:Glycosyl transferase n=1 Tax=Mesoterricola silvestris TaxID=2927979 RepID=A0AA48GNP4_9BACT|nr:glycosyltransferase [Mesoterricola silvestris]BDU73244.1 glycosyl transferase [Mesoterricola silvestris]